VGVTPSEATPIAGCALGAHLSQGCDILGAEQAHAVARSESLDLAGRFKLPHTVDADAEFVRGFADGQDRTCFAHCVLLLLCA
jgi:hypothetical protein